MLSLTRYSSLPTIADGRDDRRTSEICDYNVPIIVSSSCDEAQDCRAKCDGLTDSTLKVCCLSEREPDAALTSEEGYEDPAASTR